MRKAFTVSAVLLVFAIPLIIIFFVNSVFKTTERIVKQELNNEFIDSDYQNWKTINLPNSSTIKIPINWNFCVDGDAITIIENGREVAKGIVLEEKDGANKSSFHPDYSAFIDSCCGFPIKAKTRRELTVTNLGTGASYYLQFYTGYDGSLEEHYQLSLTYQLSTSIILDFGDNKKNDADMVLDQIEAMAFSYDQK